MSASAARRILSATVEGPIRLENAFIPRAYDLKIKVDLENWTYEGEERIQFMRNPDPDVPFRNTTTLHRANSMEIRSVRGASIARKVTLRETIMIQFPNEALAQGDASTPEVTFKFRHKIQEELRGFYRVKYRHNGQEHRMASTHFEPTSARLFFICQDEPAARADFTLQVSLPTSHPNAEGYTVLSNTPLQKKTVEDGYIVHAFETITRCPPYLLACVVGELESVTTTAGASNLPVSVYTTPGKTPNAGFALETCAFALNFFEEFFQHPFPLPKLDIVAVPDFPIGGMENWGCICCIESILIDEAVASISAKKRASELLCHEVSHNWFGNLVAIDWWEGLWLKEGFASWCGNYASHIRNPTWRCLEDAMKNVTGAKEVDQYDHSHPVEVPINDPADITQIFDRISYDKGMGLVFMLQAFLGEEKWGPAVAHYIRTHAFSATATNQLWEALEESSGEPIADVMRSFTTQLGFPLVHVERKSPEIITIRQQPCRLATTSQHPRAVEVLRRKVKPTPVEQESPEGHDGGQEAEPAVATTEKKESEEGGEATAEGAGEAAERRPEEAEEEEMELVTVLEDTIWSIPVTLEGPEGKVLSVVLEGDEPLEVEANEADFPYVIVNPRRTGFYRVRYDDALFHSLVQEHYAKLDTSDRCALLSDVKAAIFMGMPDLSRLGVLSEVVRRCETETLVLQELASTILSFTGAFDEGEMVSRLRRAQLSFFVPMAESYTTEEAQKAAAEDVQLQVRHTFVIELALTLLIRHYHPSEALETPLLQWALSQARAFLAGEPFQRSTIGLCLAAYNRLDRATTPASRQAELFEAFQKVDGQDELSRALLTGLCATPEPTYVEEILVHCMMNTRIRSQYGGNVFYGALTNGSLKTGQLWQFFGNNFEKIKEQWGGGQFRIQLIVEYVAASLSGDEAAEEYEKFFVQNDLENAQLATKRSVENIRVRAWLRRRWSPEDLLKAFDPHEL